jgi:hypothetical protein
MEKIQGIEGQRITRIYSAKFYFFKYITYNPNEYYNVFPLVFSLGKVPKSKKSHSHGTQSEMSDSGAGGGDSLFRGLDFHYLPPEMRIPLLDELRKISPDLYRSPVAFSKFFRNLMWKVRKYRSARVCYRHYIIKNIKGGKILRIHKDNWNDLLMTPKVEHFVTSTFGKYSSERVWKNSLKEMRKSGRA